MKRHFEILFLILTFASCKTYETSLRKTESTNIVITSSISSENKEVDDLVLPYKKGIDSVMNTVLNQSKTEMAIGSPEGLLGNFVCDLVLEVGNEIYKKLDSNNDADFSLLNNGGLRTSLPKGEITRRKIFELMPFENQLVVVTLSPEKMLELFQYIGKKTTTATGRKNGVPISGNVKVELVGTTPKVAIINGQKIRGRNYKVITSDYLANGGDKMYFFVNPVKIEKLGIKLRDAIIQHIEVEKEKGNKINASLDKRIEYVK